MQKVDRYGRQQATGAALEAAQASQAAKASRGSARSGLLVPLLVQRGPHGLQGPLWLRENLMGCRDRSWDCASRSGHLGSKDRSSIGCTDCDGGSWSSASCTGCKGRSCSSAYPADCMAAHGTALTAVAAEIAEKATQFAQVVKGGKGGYGGSAGLTVCRDLPWSSAGRTGGRGHSGRSAGRSLNIAGRAG